jgi:hypothetical protein
MSYAKSNPLFELDIYRSQIDNSWNFFLSIFRWSFAIQLSKPQLLNYYEYLDGNYSNHQQHVSAHESFKEEIEAWYEKDSVEGEEHDDHEYHELEGIYYSHGFQAFAEVKQFSEDLFQIEYENIPNTILSIFQKERVKAIAIERNLKDDLWEKVISL